MTVHVELDVHGPAAPPRSNGELVFAEPWESRTFGMAMALTDAGVLDWDDFRDALVARIKQWEADPPEGERWSYYRCWQLALEDSLIASGVVTKTGVSDRSGELATRPAGHDHDHDDTEASTAQRR
jgi:nitrile hydratase accessory protein